MNLPMRFGANRNTFSLGASLAALVDLGFGTVPFPLPPGDDRSLSSDCWARCLLVLALIVSTDRAEEVFVSCGDLTRSRLRCEVNAVV